MSIVIKIVEKKNKRATHGIFDTIERAENHLKNIIPVYCAKGYFMDKTLMPDDFEVIKTTAQPDKIRRINPKL